MKNQKLILNDKGVVLVTGLFFLLFLTIIGATALITTTNDVTISGNYKSIKEAFYNAEAGVHFSLSAIENGLKANTFTMPTEGNPVDLTFAGSIPSAYDILLSKLEWVSDNKYRFISTGQSRLRGAETKIQAIIRIASGFEFAAFGDELLDMNTNDKIYSYSSEDYAPNAVPSSAADSTHEADIGSNVKVNMDTVEIDGDVKLGEKSGTTASTTSNGTQTVYGENGEEVGPVPSDPLGMLTEIPEKFAALDQLGGTVDTDNDESTYFTTTDLTDLELGHGEILRGQSGGSNFYFESISLGSSESLKIDASDGPINIFVKGYIDLGNDSTINILNGSSERPVKIYLTEGSSVPNPIINMDNSVNINIDGPPTSFGIFSDTTANMVIRNSGAFKGVVYAPKASLDIKADAGIYGAVWANKVDLKSDTTIFYDTTLQNKYLSDEVLLTGWTQRLE